MAYQLTTLFQAVAELTKQADEVAKSLGITWDNY
jgi:hypothetical protein